MATASTMPSVELRESTSTGAFERRFMVVALVLCGGSFVNLFFSVDALLDSGTGMPGFRYLWAAIYAIAIALLIRNCPGALRTLLREYPVILLVLLAVVSSVWSTSSGVSLRRAISLLGFTLVAVYFANRFSIREQLRLLGWSSAICLACSYLFGLFGIGHSVDNLRGAWSGIYTQRNGLGAVMSLAALVFLLCASLDRRWRYGNWLLAIAAVGLVLLSGSVTSLVVSAMTVISFLLVHVLWRSKHRQWLLLMAVAIIGLSAWCIASSFDDVAEAMGRDSSLTGRVEVWGASADLGGEKPWLGYGYNGFWLGLEGPSAEVWRIAGWAAPSAHNGVLEIWLDLGIIGVAIAGFGFVLYMRRAYRLVCSTGRWEFAWPLMFLILLCVQNLTESAFLSGNSIHWFLYVATALNLSRFRTRTCHDSTAISGDSSAVIGRPALAESGA